MSFEIITVGVVCADIMARPVDDFPKRGTLAIVPQMEMHLGGLAGVAAAVFSKLGGEAAFIGKLGEDNIGNFLLSMLNQAGVNTAGVRRDAACTSSATMVLIDSNGERTFLHHMGTNAVTGVEDLDFEVIKHAKMLHWGGPGITPMLEGEAMAGLMKRAREAGLKTSMDTCYDGSGRWLPLIEPVLPHLDVVLTSFEEAQLYTGQKSREDIASFLLSYGPEVVVIKLGENGIYVRSADTEFHIPAYPVEVVDTTGAGDASCGAFLFGYLRGMGLEASARLANAVGALTVGCMGGSNGVKSLAQVKAFMAQMTNN